MFKWFKNKSINKLALLTTLITPGVLSSCGLFNQGNGLVFANYQSYMSPWLINYLASHYDAKFQFFNVAETVPSQYRLHNYDVSVVSTSVLDNLISQDLVHKIQWNKFNLKHPETGKTINNATEALALYTEPVKKILSQTYTDAQGQSINLLDYGIPYFLQTFNFVYRGDKISQLNPANPANNLSWKKMLETISSETRFQSQPSNPNLTMVDDPRTLLSIANLLDNNSDGVNPDQNHRSVAALTNTYNKYVSDGLSREKLGVNPILLNSDSNILIDLLSQGPDAGGVNGGFLYNGDILYAANGGDQEIEVDPDTFHIVKNDKTLYALDMINFAKFTETTTNKLDRMYQLTKKISFEGLNDDDGILSESDKDDSLTANDLAIAESETSINCNTDQCHTYDANIMDQNPDDANSYKYAPAINFDSVNYTPVLKKLYYELLGAPIKQQKPTVTGSKSSKNPNKAAKIEKVRNSSDPTIDDVTAIIEDSYFYEPVEDVVFGKKNTISVDDLSTLNDKTWDSLLDFVNLATNKSTNKGLEVVAAKYDETTKEIIIKYKIYNYSGSQLTSEVEVTYNGEKSAIDNLQELEQQAKKKAIFQANIMIINDCNEINKYVEKKLDDLTRSNMSLAFNNLKRQW